MKYAWKIFDAPHGATVKLVARDAPQPVLNSDEPGTYPTGT